jgi:osmotically-inducible protein OsmY
MATLRRTLAETCLALGLLLPGAAVARAAAPRLPTTLPICSEMRDDAAEQAWLLTYRARRALMQDPILAPLNLGVSMRSGRLVLWGFVPSTAVARKAEQRLHALAGPTPVRSDLQVLRPDEFLVDVLNRETSSVPALVSLPEALQMPAQLTSRWADGSAPAVAASFGVALLPPLTVPSRAPQRLERSVPPVENLAALVKRLHGSEARFRSVHVEVNGSVVSLGGAASRPEDVMALAQMIARLPGVERVSVQTK